MINIVNLTKFNRFEGQDGLFDITNEEIKATLWDALTFTTPPTVEEIEVRADTLVSIAVAADASAAMIDGAPYLMGILERKLLEAGIKPLYAFTRREVVEQEQTVDRYNDGDGGRRGYRHTCCDRYGDRTRVGYGRNRSGDHRDDSYGSRGYGHSSGFSDDDGYGRRDRDIPERGNVHVTKRDGEMVGKAFVLKHLGWVEVSK